MRSVMLVVIVLIAVSLLSSFTTYTYYDRPNIIRISAVPGFAYSMLVTSAGHIELKAGAEPELGSAKILVIVRSPDGALREALVYTSGNSIKIQTVPGVSYLVLVVLESRGARDLWVEIS